MLGSGSLARAQTKGLIEIEHVQKVKPSRILASTFFLCALCVTLWISEKLSKTLIGERIITNWVVMKIRGLMSLIIMDLLLLMTALVNALLSLPMEIQVALPIIVFIVAAVIVYKEESRKEAITHEEEKSEREARFIKRFDNLMNEFVEKIVNVVYIYSITSIANKIANDEIIRQQKTAWQLFLSHLNDDLTTQSILLHDRIKQRKAEFKILFQEFDSLLSLLRKFRNKFYEMVADTRKLNQSFATDLQFKKNYKKFSEEFDKYMDKLEIFSDEVKVEFGLSLKKELTEHVKDLEELYKS